MGGKIGLAPGLRRFKKDREKVISDLQALESRAHKCSLHVTAQVINRAKNAAGWEIQGNTEQAGKAGRDER